MDEQKGFLRLPQIIGNPKAKPPIPAIIPLSRSTWWAGIRLGIYPKPIKLSQRTSAWRRVDIDNLCVRLSTGQQLDKVARRIDQN